MDTSDDLITAEFLHLLFFEQKNLVIFPYIDLKHLRSLDLFTVGFETVDIDSTVIHNLNEIIEYEENNSYSQLQTIYFVLNPSIEELEKLLDSTRLRCVINSKENVEGLANGDQFVFYNKKTKEFLNYDFESRDLSFEKEIIRSSPNTQVIMDELLKIRSVSSKIFAELNLSSSSDNFPEILDKFDQIYWNKILRFTELYCQIEIPDFHRPVQLPKKKKATKEIDYSAEYESIIKTNRKIGRSFIQLVHDFRYDKVNPANLEVGQLYYPQKLYNYLRNHHWKKGIPKEFAINWFKKATKDFSNPGEALLEFQVILNKLQLTYTINDTDLERKIEPEKKGENQSEKLVSISNRKKQPKSHAIPSTDNFPEFKKWLLSKLSELEKIV